MQSYNEQGMEEQEYTADEELEESHAMANESEVCCVFNGYLK